MWQKTSWTIQAVAALFFPDEELVSEKLDHQHPKIRPKPAAVQFQFFFEKVRLFYKEGKTLRVSCPNLNVNSL